jgi:integrase
MRRRPRGSGTIIEEGNGLFGIRYAVAHGRKAYETGFRTKREAENRLALIRAESMQRRHGIAADPRLAPTLGTLATSWLERRAQTHAAGKEDGYRWKGHLAPHFGHLRPGELDTARVRTFVETKLKERAPGTVRVMLSVLSMLYEDLIERGVTAQNPVRHLPKSILRMVRSDHDPKTVPFLERLDDVRRVHLALPPPLHVAYAVGAFAGLRTGEVFALRWTSVDFAGRRIVVCESVKGPLKDHDSRIVPILDPLLPVLHRWKLETGGEGRVVPPMRVDGDKIDKHTPGTYLRAALHELGLGRPGFGLPPTHRSHKPLAKQKLWYWCTRHTFASQWAMSGRPLRELQAILGHTSIAVTEKYAHLVPGYFADGVYGALKVDLATPRPASVGQIGTGNAETASVTPRKNSKSAGAAL